MEISINVHEPLPLHTQLSEQLKYHIEAGTWSPGDRLPNVRDLAASLRLNYHTVRTTYQELERQGYLRSEQGRGTYVAAHPPLLPTDGPYTLLDLIDDALLKAQAIGVSAEMFVRTASARAKLMSPMLAQVRLLFIECNEPDLKHHARTIKQEMGISPETMLVSDLPHADPSIFRSFDVVTTPLFHVAEVQAILGSDQLILGLLVTPSSSAVLADLASLPQGTPVGLLCVTPDKARSMERALLGTGLTHVHFVTAGMDHPEQVQDVLQHTNPIYVSRMGLSAQNAPWPETRQIREYVTELDSAALRLLRREITHRLASEHHRGGHQSEAERDER